MRKFFVTAAVSLSALLPFAASAEPLPYIDTTTEADGVVALPDSVDSLYTDIFSKYTKVIAPNGYPIHILAHEDVEDETVYHAAQVLRQHVTDVDGTTYGDDKSSVANAMANNEAILSIYASQEQADSIDRDDFQNQTNTQDLKESQMYLEGTSSYTDEVEPGRNAAYEEILHMVQDYGITPGYTEMQSDIDDALDIALDEGFYNPLDDLEESSYDQEYFAIGMESYFGFWEHDPNGDGKAGGQEYDYITRTAVEENDTELYDIISGYFGEYILYNALIDEDFTGTFTLTYDADTTYTNKSQYLKDATLQGINDSNLTGNSTANELTGNSGDNTLTGGGGNDTLFSGGGTDTAVFTGNQSQYTRENDGCRVTVTDNTADRDGTDTLIGINRLQFSDATIPASVTNSAPVLSEIVNQNTEIGSAIDITISALDVDEVDQVSYTASSSTSNVSLAIEDGVLTMSPASGFEGSADITVTATDQNDCDDSETFTLHVVGELERDPKVIEDITKRKQRIRVEYEGGSEDFIRPYPGSKKFRMAVSTDGTRLVVTNGKNVKVYVNGEKESGIKIAKKTPKKLKHLRLKVGTLYNRYDTVVVASTRGNAVRMRAMRLNDANKLKKKKSLHRTTLAKAPVKIQFKKKKKRVIITTGSKANKQVYRIKVRKGGKMTLL